MRNNGGAVPENLQKSCILQANPRLYYIDAALATLKQMTWSVSSHKNEIAPGDEVFLWRSDPDAGILPSVPGMPILGGSYLSHQFRSAASSIP